MNLFVLCTFGIAVVDKKTGASHVFEKVFFLGVIWSHFKSFLSLPIFPSAAKLIGPNPDRQFFRKINF